MLLSLPSLLIFLFLTKILFDEEYYRSRKMKEQNTKNVIPTNLLTILKVVDCMR